eukprot:jgi/Hompol1/467/HPOL_001747-RA
MATVGTTPGSVTASATTDGITLTIRVIKSFEYRTTKNLVLHNISPAMRTSELKQLVQQSIKTAPGFKPYLTTKFDTLKIYVKAHGSKSMNLVINLDNDDTHIMEDDKLLKDYDAENETEISFFNREAYEAYKAHPETKW